jgi:hypothetical protein
MLGPKVKGEYAQLLRAKGISHTSWAPLARETVGS